MTPEKYIKAYTRGCSNELVYGGYHEWLTPENALAAVELARSSKVLDALTRDDMEYICELYDQIPYMKEEDFYDEMLRRFKTYKGL